jgi:hypothetical protein
MGSGGDDSFSERLGPPETREATWRHAVNVRANNMRCRLVWTDVDFNGPDLLRHGPQAARYGTDSVN